MTCHGKEGTDAVTSEGLDCCLPNPTSCSSQGLQVCWQTLILPIDTGGQEIRAPLPTVLPGQRPSSPQKQGGPPRQAEASQIGKEALHPTGPRVLKAASSQGSGIFLKYAHVDTHATNLAPVEHWTRWKQNTGIQERLDGSRADPAESDFSLKAVSGL